MNTTLNVAEAFTKKHRGALAQLRLGISAGLLARFVGRGKQENSDWQADFLMQATEAV
jgi:hypothetical protein